MGEVRTAWQGDSLVGHLLSWMDRTLDTCYMKFYIPESGVLIAGCPHCSKAGVSVSHSRKGGRVETGLAEGNGVHMTRAPRVVLTAALDRTTQGSEQKVGYSQPDGLKVPP